MFDVVLVHPEIPNNTGCIGRTVLGAGCRLHLIKPLGFDLSEKALRRAGLDYWSRVPLQIHNNWQDFTSRSVGQKRLTLLSAKAKSSVYDFKFCGDDVLVFGGESRGLPAEILAAENAHQYCIPVKNEIRSLNLATAVGVVVFEGIRQLSR